MLRRERKTPNRFVKLALLLKARFFKQVVALIPKSLVGLVRVTPPKRIHLLEKVSLLQLRDVPDLGQKCVYR